MAYIKIIFILLVTDFVVNSIAVKDKSSVDKLMSLKKKDRIKKHSLHYRQSTQKCYLVCPEQTPIELPSNFLHNCTVTGTTSIPKGTTRRTATTTSTSSGEEGENTEENTEETRKASKNTSKNGSGGRKNKQQKYRRSKTKSKNLHGQMRNQHHGKHHKNKKTNRLRREKVFIKQEAKSQIFGKKNFREKPSLDGCYVVCSEGNEEYGKPGSTNQEQGEGDEDGDEDGDGGEESGSDESDDHYVQGEDTPIEIIYIPPVSSENRKPVDLYQTNNFETFSMGEYLEPQPYFGYGYDPFFMEGKHKKIKKSRNQKKLMESKFVKPKSQPLQ